MPDPRASDPPLSTGERAVFIGCAVIAAASILVLAWVIVFAPEIPLDGFEE